MPTGSGRRLGRRPARRRRRADDGELAMTRARKIAGRVTFVGCRPRRPRPADQRTRVDALRQRRDRRTPTPPCPTSIRACAVGRDPRTRGARRPTPPRRARPRPAPAPPSSGWWPGTPFVDDDAVREALAVARTGRAVRRRPGRVDRAPAPLPTPACRSARVHTEADLRQTRRGRLRRCWPGRRARSLLTVAGGSGHLRRRSSSCRAGSSPTPRSP